MKLTMEQENDTRTYCLDGCKVMIDRTHYGNIKNPPVLFVGAHYFAIRRDDLARTLLAIRKHNIEHTRWEALIGGRQV